MNASFFKLELDKKQLRRIPTEAMSSLGLNEPFDLEAWLASAKELLFGRSVLWICRQDSPTADQRSDLVGLNTEGDLIIAELKRGMVDESAVTQGLSYAARYSEFDRSRIEQIYCEHSQKASATGLVLRAESHEKAVQKVRDHIGRDTEINLTQALVLVGESFSSRTLAICQYLASNLGEGLTIECWQYSVLREASGSHYFALEQIFPPPSLYSCGDSRTEEMGIKTRGRDSVRMSFMTRLQDFLSSQELFRMTKNKGESYGCRFTRDNWPAPVAFSVHGSHPRLDVPSQLQFMGEGDTNVSKVEGETGSGTVTLIGIDCDRAVFDANVQDTIDKVLNGIVVRDHSPAQ